MTRQPLPRPVRTVVVVTYSSAVATRTPGAICLRRIIPPVYSSGAFAEGARQPVAGLLLCAAAVPGAVPFSTGDSSKAVTALLAGPDMLFFTDSRIASPWLTRPAATSLSPSDPFRTVRLAPASPAAASLTICGSWSISILSSATRLLEAAASACTLVRCASACASTRTFSASASAGLMTSATSWRCRSPAWRSASSACAARTPICACACASGPAWAASACALSTSALYCACTTEVCRALGQLGLRRQDSHLCLRLRQRAGLGGLGLRLVHFRLVLRLHDRGLPGVLRLGSLRLLLRLGRRLVGLRLRDLRLPLERRIVRRGHRVDVAGGDIVDRLDLQRVDRQSDLNHLRLGTVEGLTGQLLPFGDDLLHGHRADDRAQVPGENPAGQRGHLILIRDRKS